LASETAKVQVSNIQGQLVYEGAMSNGKITINTADWNTGVYMVAVEGATYHYSTKILVRH
jgi:hypothetical protein